MNSIPKFEYGDIVLISYPFSDLTTFKKRPCIILKELSEDILVVFISSQLLQKRKGDIFVRRDEKNNLAVDSLIKVWKITTIHKGLIITKIGELDKRDKIALKETLVKNFDTL